ncbi:hypothetical protein [uncultured Tenacibaculum sp.]|uniref:hypothetical protein n=1 Tax=uncultured Tenacibaculum sp. TaxID=174713 RepID=UPI0026311A6C|nr:hypothetical protein [uncultured Tenacibaculum sp.]
MKNLIIFLNVLFLTINVSCKKNNNEKCRIDDLKKAIILPKKYDFIFCESRVYEVLIHLKLDEKNISFFLNNNPKFLLYKEIEKSIPSSHYIFFNRLEDYFKNKDYPDISNTYFYEVDGNHNNYLSCILTSEGDLFMIFEKGALPVKWDNKLN